MTTLNNTWNLDYDNQILEYVSGTGTDTVLDLYEWVQEQLALVGGIDDIEAVDPQTPWAIRLKRGWFIKDADTQYLKNGSIATYGWDAASFNWGIRKLSLTSVGYTACVAGDIGKTVTGSVTGDTGMLVDYDESGSTKYWWVRVTDTGDEFDNASEDYSISGGTGDGTANAVSSTGESLWSCAKTQGDLVVGSTIYACQNGIKLTGWWGTGHPNSGDGVLFRVKEDGNWVDNGFIFTFVRRWGYKFWHWSDNLQAGGYTTFTMLNSADINNATIEATVATWTDVTITFGATMKDIGDGSGAQPYRIVVDGGGRPLSEIYERLKYVCRDGATDALNGVEGQQYISYDPDNYAIIREAPFGTYQGGKFFGAQGLWIENFDADDANNIVLIDHNGVTRTPPLSIPVKMTGLESGVQCGIFIEAAQGDKQPDKSLYTTAAGNDLGDGTVEIVEDIDSDIPSSGVVRIENDYYAYASWSGKIFTLDGVTLTKSYAAGVGVYTGFIDEASAGTSINKTIQYDHDRWCVIRARKAGKLPFETEVQLTNSGISVPVTLSDDPIYIG